MFKTRCAQCHTVEAGGGEFSTAVAKRRTTLLTTEISFMLQPTRVSLEWMLIVCGICLLQRIRDRNDREIARTSSADLATYRPRRSATRHLNTIRRDLAAAATLTIVHLGPSCSWTQPSRSLRSPVRFGRELLVYRSEQKSCCALVG